MSRKMSVLLGYDLLLHPMKLVATLCSFSHKAIFVKQLDLLMLLEELGTLKRLAVEPIQDTVFSPTLHKLIIDAMIKDIIAPVIKLSSLPNVSEIEALVVEQPVSLFESIRKRSLNSDEPVNALSSLWILKEALDMKTISIIKEKPAYVCMDNSCGPPEDIYRDLLDPEIKYYPFLPRYEKQYQSRRCLVQTAICEKMAIATSAERLGRWLDTNGVPLYSLQKMEEDVLEETLAYDPTAFFLEDAVKIIRQEINSSLLSRIVQIQKRIAERELLRAQLKPDLILNIVGLYPLGFIPRMFSWFAKLSRYIRLGKPKS